MDLSRKLPIENGELDIALVMLVLHQLCPSLTEFWPKRREL
jgi:hypothetical protein